MNDLPDRITPIVVIDPDDIVEPLKSWRGRFIDGSSTQQSVLSLASHWDITGAELVDLVNPCCVALKDRRQPKDGRYYMPAEMLPQKAGATTTQRKRHLVAQMSAAVFDLDRGSAAVSVIARLRRSGFCCILVPTYSHMRQDFSFPVPLARWSRYIAEFATVERIVDNWCHQHLDPDIADGGLAEPPTVVDEPDKHRKVIRFVLAKPCPRWRVIVPLAEPWLPPEGPGAKAAKLWADVYLDLARALGLYDADGGCSDITRLHFSRRWPLAWSIDGPWDFALIDYEPGPRAGATIFPGALATVDALLARLATTTWLERLGEVENARRERAFAEEKAAKAAAPGAPGAAGEGAPAGGSRWHMPWWVPRPDGRRVDLSNWHWHCGHKLRLLTRITELAESDTSGVRLVDRQDSSDGNRHFVCLTCDRHGTVRDDGCFCWDPTDGPVSGGRRGGKRRGGWYCNHTACRERSAGERMALLLEAGIVSWEMLDAIEAEVRTEQLADAPVDPPQEDDDGADGAAGDDLPLAPASGPQERKANANGSSHAGAASNASSHTTTGDPAALALAVRRSIPGAEVSNLRDALASAKNPDIQAWFAAASDADIEKLWDDAGKKIWQQLKQQERSHSHAGGPPPQPKGPPQKPEWNPYDVPKPPPWPGGILLPEVEDRLALLCQRNRLDLGAAAVTHINAGSGAIPKLFRFQPYVTRKLWLEPPCLWDMLVGESGVRKTLLLRLGFAPFYALEDRLRRDYATRLEVWENPIDAEGNPLALPRAKRGAKPKEPWDYLIEDTSYEMVHAALTRDDRGSALIVDEIAGFFDFDRYGGGKAGRALYLKSYDDAAHKLMRISRGTLFARHVGLSLWGTVQPSRIAKLIEQLNLADDGFLQRVSPLLVAEGGDDDDDAALDDGDLRFLHAPIERLLDLDVVERRFTTIPEASAVIRETELAAREYAQGAGLSAAWPGFCRKLHGAHARRALAMHLLENLREDVIGADVVRRAARLTDYLLAHALSFHSSLPGAEHTRRLEIADWLLAKDPQKGRVTDQESQWMDCEVIVPSDLTNNVWSCREVGAEGMAKVLDQFVGRGWLFRETDYPGNRKWYFPSWIREAMGEEARRAEARREAVHRRLTLIGKGLGR